MSSKDRDDLYQAIECVDRMGQCFVALGISAKTQCLMTTFLLYPGPWAIRGLSDYICWSRASIRQTLTAWEQIGISRCCDDRLWSLTETGRETLEAIMGECLAITMKERRRFSPGLLECIGELMQRSELTRGWTPPTDWSI